MDFIHNINWYWLTIVYIVLFVAAELINKKSVSHVAVDEIIFGASIQLTTGIICLILAMLTGWRFDFNETSILLLLLMTLSYIGAVSMYFTGLKHVELSLVTIFTSISSVGSLVLGFLLLKEPLTTTKILGTLFILMASAVVSVKKWKISLDKYSWITIAAGFCYAIGAILDKRLNTFGNPLSYIALSFGIVGSSMLLVYYKRTARAMSASFRNKDFWKGIALNGLFYSLGFWSLFEAYHRGGEVSRMFPMTLSISLFVPLLGIILLKERNDLSRKFIAIAIMIGGLWALGK